MIPTPTATPSTPTGNWRWGVAAASLLLLLCGTAAWIGAVPIRIFGHDTFFLLDNGWRVLNGQRVHVEYSSPWGPLTFLIVGAGLKLSGLAADGLGYANSGLGLIVGVWGWILTRYRLHPALRVLVAAFLAGLVVAPYPLGWGILSTSHAMVYNRYGYALLALIVIECFAPLRQDATDRRDGPAGLSTGALLGLLLFLKISYFLAAGVVLVAAIAIDGSTRRRIGGVLLGFFVVTSALLAYLGFHVQAMVGDWRMAAGAKAGSLTPDLFVQRIQENVLSFVMYAWLGWRGGGIGRAAGDHRYRFLFVALSLLAVDAFLVLTNQQPTQMPLGAVLAILAIQRALDEKHSAAEADSAVSPKAVVILGGMLFASQFAFDVAGLAFGAGLKAAPGDLSKIARFRAPGLASVILYDGFSDPRSNGRQYVRYVNKGEALLRARLRPGEKVLNIDMMNPFPYTLGDAPPLGGVAAAAYKYMQSDDFHPSESAYFGNADVVMVPKHPSSPGVYYDGFYRIYEHALHERFTLVVETKRWYLYRRR